MGVLDVCVSVDHMHAWCLWIFGTGLANVFEPQRVYLELNPVLVRAGSALTPKPSLLPLSWPLT